MLVRARENIQANERGHHHQNGSKLSGSIILAETNLRWGYCTPTQRKLQILYFPLERAGSAIDHVYMEVLASFWVKGHGLPRGNELCTCALWKA